MRLARSRASKSTAITTTGHDQAKRRERTMSGASGEDPSGYLPPHELRGLGGNLVDRDDMRPPGPRIATTSSPRLATAAAEPSGIAPTLPPDDPGSIAIAIARMLGEPLG